MSVIRYCPICGKEAEEFLPFGLRKRENAKCPNCGSLERHRALWLLMEREGLFEPSKTVLHFAPEKTFLTRFREVWGENYWPVDLNPKMHGVRKAVDITEIPFEDGTFDLIVCNHVLEHIPDEKKAVAELSRVLKRDGGTALISVPVFRTEKTLEKPEYNTPELREKYYGQHDHVRAYGRDFGQRLSALSDFSVTEVQMDRQLPPEDAVRYCLYDNDHFYICTRGKGLIQRMRDRRFARREL